jgi:heterodisulfide reductase subunit B
MESTLLIKNGRSYPIHQYLHGPEKAPVKEWLKQLAKNDREFDKIDKSLAKFAAKQETVENLRKYNELNIKKLELTESSQKVLSKLDEAKRTALHYCYNLNYQDIDKLDPDEARKLFLSLVEMKGGMEEDCPL